MPINKKKLALILSIPIFMASSIPGKQWYILRDLPRAYYSGRINQVEYEYAASLGKTVTQFRTDEYNKCMKSHELCIARTIKDAETSRSFWISPSESVNAICNCSIRGTLGPLPTTLSNHAAGIVTSLKTLTPVARNLLISLIISWFLVFSFPALFRRINMWLYK